jgi:tRNA-Thr(GGU) m(6)t(6)A37 methyltransferase TsaA
MPTSGDGWRPRERSDKVKAQEPLPEQIVFHPIGRVENSFDEPAKPEEIRAVRSRIILDADLVPGLVGLEPGQQIMVIFVFHRSAGYDLRQHPRGDSTRPLRGVFALRSPRRPNPIGVSLVRLVAYQENILEVDGLDAINGTPVLDIKPA